MLPKPSKCHLCGRPAHGIDGCVILSIVELEADPRRKTGECGRCSPTFYYINEIISSTVSFLTPTLRFVRCVLQANLCAGESFPIFLNLILPIHLYLNR